MTAHRLLDPTLDIVFSLLFGAKSNRAVLLGFLNAVLRPSSPITHVNLLPQRPQRQDVDDKDIVLDLRARFENGEQVDVEMQNRGGPGVRKRALYYWSRLFTGEPTKGVAYDQLRRCVVIFIANFSMLKSSKYHSIFRSAEITTGEVLTEEHEIHVLELPKLGKAVPGIDEPADVLWGRFLCAKTGAELERLAMQDPLLEQAKEALEALSADPDARIWAERRATALRMYYVEKRADREEAQAEGMAQGMAEGMAQGMAEGMAQGMAEGMAQGMAEGMAQGMAEGMAEGMAQGMAQGTATGRVQALLDLLEARGLSPSAEEVQRLMAVRDESALKRLVHRALTVTRVEELFEE